MQHHTLLLLLFLVSAELHAQEMTTQEAQANLKILGGAGYTARTFDDRYEGVKGFPTLFEKYMAADIRLADGKRFTNKATNLDVVNQELIIVKNEKEWILSKSVVRNFTFFDGKDSVRFIKLNVEESGEVYFQQLVKGEIELLKLHSKTFVKADYKGAYSSGRTQDEFRNTKKYFLKLSEDKVEEIKTKKDLQKLLPQHQAWLETFIKENKLDVKEESHLISLIENLNSANTSLVK